MKTAVVAVLAAAVTSGVFLCGGAVVAVVAVDGYNAGMHPDNPADMAMSCGTAPVFVNVAATPTDSTPTVAGFTEKQVANAAVIVHVGQQMSVPPRGLVIAVATAMQESSLYNSAKETDHDSVGLFQQRPSQDWGTKTQIMDPVYASRKFYEKLLQIPGWQSLPLTVAAQKVQHSAFPHAYAKHEPAATRLVNAVTGGAGNAATVAGQCAQPGQVTAGGWTIPVVGAVVGSPFGPRGGRLHAGVDLIIGKHHKIVAASAGTVVYADCQPSTRTHGGCDRDGSPSVPGCGWYVDLKHADNVYTRYCHMVSRPLVTVGQQVQAGQQIGWSGTSGHSSGPHLHFEVHKNSPHKDGAIDPVPWMKDHGAPL